VRCLRRRLPCWRSCSGLIKIKLSEAECLGFFYLITNYELQITNFGNSLRSDNKFRLMLNERMFSFLIIPNNENEKNAFINDAQNLLTGRNLNSSFVISTNGSQNLFRLGAPTNFDRSAVLFVRFICHRQRSQTNRHS